MHFFDFAEDIHSRSLIAQKLSWESGIAILLLVVVFIGWHLLRRAFGRPRRLDNASAPPPSALRFERYEVGARLYHWGNFGVMALLILSGAALFFPSLAFSIKSWLGISWLLAHEVVAGTFIVFLIFHILFAIFETGLRQMWFTPGAGRALAQRLRFYSGGSAFLPREGKYDVIQKIYHALLTLFALVMIGTGVTLFLSAEVIVTLDHNWLRWLRILHDIFAFLFTAVILGHIYLRLLPSRWPEVAAIITGKISRRDFERQHDWRRWQPPVKEHRPEAVGAAVAP